MRNWNEETIAAEAAKYKTKKEFCNSCKPAYNAAVKRYPGLIDNLLPNIRTYWNVESVRVAAAAYKSKAEFERECQGAYQFAIKRAGFNLIDELFPTPSFNAGTNDVIYIWRAVGLHYNGHPIYKIGVTSRHLGLRRCKQVSRDNKMDMELITLTPVWCDADIVEKQLLLLGEDPKLICKFGATEFRALSGSALSAALQIISGYAAP